MDPAAITAATTGAKTIICALGLPYFSDLWETGWPLAMTNALAACEANGAKLVFADNLYLYGPQNQPLIEDLSAVDYGRKPKARTAAETTRALRELMTRHPGRVRTITADNAPSSIALGRSKPSTREVLLCPFLGRISGMN